MIHISYPYRQPCGCMATDPKWVRRCADHQAELLALVAECAECGGKGVFNSHREDPGGHSVLECWECADARTTLAEAERVIRDNPQLARDMGVTLEDLK